MENSLKPLIHFIASAAKLQTQISSNKLSQGEVKALMQLVDVKGKGYLQLSDVYDLVGKVSEEELFRVFKWMDRARNGQIRVQQLMQCLGDASLTTLNTSKQYIFPKFYLIVDTVKDRPRLLAQAKSSLGLTQNQLKQTYHYICSLVQSKYLAPSEIVTVMKTQAMKYGIKWENQHQKVIRELLPGQSVNENKFVQCFGSNTTVNNEKQEEEEDLLAGLQSHSNQTTPKKQEPVRPTPVSLSQKPIAQAQPEQNASIIYKKSNNFFQPQKQEPQPLQAPSFRENRFQSSPKQQNCQYKREFDQIEGNINGVLEAIQQRRERLRQDSQERKKLIEDVMNRKRDLCGLNANKGYSSPKQPQWRAEDHYTSSYLAKSPMNRSGYLNYNQNSSPKQFSYPQYPEHKQSDLPKHEMTHSYLQKTPLNARQNFVELSQERNYSKNRPSTPPSGQISDINEILKKYNNNNNRVQDRLYEDQNTLKQLIKSKSGALSPYASTSYTSKYQEFSQNYDPRAPSRQETSFSSKCRGASKEEVMKRAEEEAARKIEEIERKARMKVLQKKNINKMEREREWRPLTKKGTYY